ncbi:MAG: monooxygenase [Gordonia sp.]|nr:monooxygenase [Gordonia sp. (in: high G+C Gram-positive bacteria)]
MSPNHPEAQPAPSDNPRGSFVPSRDFTDVDLDRALSDANLPYLLGSLALLTGNDRWISAPFLPTAPKDLGNNDSGGFDEETGRAIRLAASAILRDWRDGSTDFPAAPPTPERLTHILSVMLSDRIPPDYGTLLGEEMGIYARYTAPAAPVDPEFRVIIIGAGISGLAMAVRLEQSGIDYLLIDKNDAAGGTWHENVYPGCGVDTPSYLYSLSFDPKPDWSSHFAPQSELAEYWNTLARKHNVLAHTRFGTAVSTAAYDEDAFVWNVTVRAADGSGNEETLTANAVVSAVGLLNQPSIPDLPGLADFEGPALHTARWDQNLDLAGKRVAVIGTGASSMQFVPAVSEIAAEVRVFQRTPQWSMPHPLKGKAVDDSTHFLNSHVPYYLAWHRAALFWRMGDKVWRLLQVDPEYPHLGRAVNKANDRLRAGLTAFIEHELDGRPDLLAKALPDYPPYGKRLLIDADWFKTLRRENVDLITDGVEQITADGVRTTHGNHYAADVLVLATGFKAVDVLASLEVRGRAGRTLQEVWGEGDGRAYLGITVPGFPNFFCLYGPNTNTGHGGTVIAGTEMQVQHVSALLAAMIDDDVAEIEVRADIHDQYNSELDKALAHTVWDFGGTSTYYRNKRGRIVTNSPWKYIDYWKRVHEPRLDEFRLTSRRPVAESSSAPAGHADQI